MLPRIEIAHAEREVHRVDVFERGRERGEVAGRHAGHDEQHGHETGPAGAGRGREIGGHEIGLSRSGSFRLP